MSNHTGSKTKEVVHIKPIVSPNGDIIYEFPETSSATIYLLESGIARFIPTSSSNKSKKNREKVSKIDRIIKKEVKRVRSTGRFWCEEEKEYLHECMKQFHENKDRVSNFCEKYPNRTPNAVRRQILRFQK